MKKAEILKNVEVIVEAIEDKKGEEIVVIDFLGKNPLCEYAVICTGRSDRNIAAIADEVDGKLVELETPKIGIEGYDVSEWILIDNGDILINIMNRDLRARYQLEALWNYGEIILRK